MCSRKLNLGSNWLGSTGFCLSVSPASWGVRSDLRLLHWTHANARFVQTELPPRALGRTWSMVYSAVSSTTPQYWQELLSRMAMLRRGIGTLSRSFRLIWFLSLMTRGIPISKDGQQTMRFASSFTTTAPPCHRKLTALRQRANAAPT